MQYREVRRPVLPTEQNGGDRPQFRSHKGATTVINFRQIRFMNKAGGFCRILTPRGLFEWIFIYRSSGLQRLPFFSAARPHLMHTYPGDRTISLSSFVSFSISDFFHLHSFFLDTFFPMIPPVYCTQPKYDRTISAAPA